MCGYEFVQHTAYKWGVNSGPTPSATTGPINDHTFKNRTGNGVNLLNSVSVKPPIQRAEHASADYILTTGEIAGSILNSNQIYFFVLCTQL
ncbi:hypothetical protein DPMN_155963 [Dreissena polymorpha]|uniref:Uncharacterized protein n=1 Tax=Dreissena polymorpha TaxID=45954 RepID=A0A9D4FS87_DREPO|nr:hypothetical protein DPMN_155963 [Dreissena polymorpha]